MQYPSLRNRWKSILACTATVWLNQTASAFAEPGVFTKALQELVDEQAIAKRGGPTIVEYLFKSDPPAPLVLHVLLLGFSLAVGFFLMKMILLFDDTKNSGYSTGIRLSAYAALLVPIVGFKDAASVTIQEWLIRGSIVTILYTALAFVLGYAYSLLKNKYGQPTVDSREYYAAALTELDSGRVDRGLWAQCLAQANGNDAQSRAAYLRLRSKNLQNDKSRT